MIHHLLSHRDPEDWLKVNQFFLGQMACIAGRWDVLQEGERTALDNSMLWLCSSMMVLYGWWQQAAEGRSGS